MASDLLAARINHWQAFKLRKYVEHIKQPIGLILTEAIQSYLNQANIPQEIIDEWLVEYRQSTQESADEVD